MTQQMRKCTAVLTISTLLFSVSADQSNAAKIHGLYYEPETATKVFLGEGHRLSQTPTDIWVGDDDRPLRIETKINGEKYLTSYDHTLAEAIDGDQNSAKALERYAQQTKNIAVYEDLLTHKIIKKIPRKIAKNLNSHTKETNYAL